MQLVNIEAYFCIGLNEMKNPWLKQLLIGLALFLAGYFMFGGGDIGKKEPEQKVSLVKAVIA